MILLLGGTGYVGQAFASELRRRGYDFIPLSRAVLDYTQFDLLFNYLRKLKPEFVINAAGYRGNPDFEACELKREETLYANTLLPQTIARVCLMRNTPWGHVSSSSIYRGVKVQENGTTLIEPDLNRPELRQLIDARSDKLRGFTESDEPNCSFLSPPCSFYTGTKALAEQAINGIGQCYIWRPGTVFSAEDHPHNWLSELRAGRKLHDAVHCASHLEDFVRACLDLWAGRAGYGVYNITNPGEVTTRQAVKLLQVFFKTEFKFEFWNDDEDFYRYGAKALSSNSLLDNSKLFRAGISLRPLETALEEALRQWRAPEPAWGRPARAGNKLVDSWV